MIRSSASSASRAVHAHAARTVSCIHVHAAPPAVYPTAPSPPHQPLRRTFTSSPTPRKRGTPIKLLPEWSWRRAWRGYPVPVVEVVNNADDADAVLETLTSSRLSIDPEPGIGQGVTLAQKHRGVSGSSSVKDGVLSVADGEGVVMLHLAVMDRFPAELRRILEDDTIEKQILGAGWWLHEIVNNEAYYGCEPHNITDLRHLAEWCWPTLADEATRPKTHNGFMTILARDMLGLRYAVPAADDVGYHMKKLQGARLDVLINQAWFAHCAGAEIRNKVLERIEFKISRSGPPIPDLMKASLVEHLIEEVHARAQWDVEEVREQVRRRRELKERE